MIDLEIIRQQNEERKRRKELATKGPWEADDSDDPVYVHSRTASARNDPVEETIDELVSEIERLREIERAQFSSDPAIAFPLYKPMSEEIAALRSRLAELEAEINATRDELAGVRNENDMLRARVGELDGDAARWCILLAKAKIQHADAECSYDGCVFHVTLPVLDVPFDELRPDVEHFTAAVDAARTKG